MINALLSSKSGGTAWKADYWLASNSYLYKQEIDRASKQVACMVPNLKEAHCLTL